MVKIAHYGAFVFAIFNSRSGDPLYPLFTLDKGNVLNKWKEQRSETRN